MNTDSPRAEFKFLLPPGAIIGILPEIESRLAGDPNALSSRYPIISEYWDSPDRDVYWERVRGLTERRKFRIRIYGSSDGSIPPAAFIEVKHKSDGRGVKRRLPWPVEEVGRLQDDVAACLRDGMESCPRDERRIRREVLALLALRGLRPACQLRYDRMAFEGIVDGGELRITFDTAVRCRFDRHTLRPDCQDFPLWVSPPGTHIMEIKTHASLPYWLRQLVGRHHLSPRGFSKYGTAMEKHDPLLRARQIPPFSTAHKVA